MKFTIETPADFSFYETVHAHGWRDLAPFQWDEAARTLARIEQMDSGKVVRLAMREAPDGGVEIETDGEEGEAEITAKVRRIFQMDLNMAGFRAFCEARAELAHIPRKKQGRLLRSPTLWEDAVKVILTTNTTWAQTKTMTRRFVAEWGAAHVSNPEIRAFPLPQRIAALNFEHFAAIAKVGYRAAALYELAQRIGEAQDFEAWNHCDLPTDELRRVAACFARDRPLRRRLPDAVSRQAGQSEFRFVGQNAGGARNGAGRFRCGRSRFFRGVRRMARAGLPFLCVARSRRKFGAAPAVES